MSVDIPKAAMVLAAGYGKRMQPLTDNTPKPMLALNGKPLIGHVIDRLVHTGSELLIVDFKTNRPPPDRAENVAPLYLKQMAAYRAALRQIFPDLPVRAFLLWTDGPKCMELPDELLAPLAP